MSKRIVTSGGVIQRANGDERGRVRQRDLDLLFDLAHGRRAMRPSPSPSCASTAPPGKTQAPPMNRAFGVRWTISTSRRSAPPRRTTTVAACRGAVGSPLSLRIVPGSGPCVIRSA